MFLTDTLYQVLEILHIKSFTNLEWTLINTFRPSHFINCHHLHSISLLKIPLIMIFIINFYPFSIFTFIKLPTGSLVRTSFWYLL